MSERARHAVTATDEEVRGRRGTVARCLCGWESKWAVRDGSAESDGHRHMMTRDPDYRALREAECNQWFAAQVDKGCKCEHIPGTYATVFVPECVMHRPKNIYRQPTPPRAHHEHRCSCHLSAPCGQCERCKHWDNADCENDCQTCEEHDDE